MPRNRLFFFVVILAGLIAIIMFIVFLWLRPGDSEDTGDLAIPEGNLTDPLAQDPLIFTDQRFIDGATVTLVYPVNLQFLTESERNFVVAPAPLETAPTPTIDPLSAPTTDPNLLVDPTATTDPALLPTTDPAALGGVPSTVNTGNPMFVFVDYTVVAGDTLYGISTRQDTSMALMAMYGIDANDIVVGKVLRLPIVSTSYCAGFRAYHLVVEGDNVFRIAQKFNTTNEAIQQANALGADFRIKTNTVLCIP